MHFHFLKFRAELGRPPASRACRSRVWRRSPEAFARHTGKTCVEVMLGFAVSGLNSGVYSVAFFGVLEGRRGGGGGRGRGGGEWGVKAGNFSAWLLLRKKEEQR